VSLGGARRQKTRQLELPLEGRGEALDGQRSGEALTAASGFERSGDNLNLPNRRMRTRMSGGVGGE
jgi:hypothetical protein